MVLLEYKIDLKKKKKCGMSALSFVKNPAIEENFITLSKEDVPLHLSINAKEHIVTGPLLVPQRKIYRTAESLGRETDGYIFFSKETIKKMFEMFLKDEIQNNLTLEHEEKTSDAKLIEAWISIDAKADKSVALGYDLPVGTAYASYKITNKELWNDIEAGKYNGFSIEASNFDVKEIHMSEDEHEHIIPDELVDIVLSKLKEIGRPVLELSDEWVLIAEDGVPVKDTNLSIESFPKEDSAYDTTRYQTRYKYVGPRDSKNRKFCASMLDMDLVFRKEDIDKLSNENPDFGDYNVFTYKGSYGCRHSWKTLLYAKIPKVTASSEEVDVETVILEWLDEKLMKK